LTSFKISQLNFDRTGDGENLKNAIFIEFPELICQHQAAYIQKTKQKVAAMGTMRQMPLQQHGMFGRD